MRKSTRDIGNINEKRASEYLENLGFKIVERNYYARKLGEIDIIAISDEVWHFIEVKSAEADFDPIYNFTPRKLKRVINSAYYYMKSKNINTLFSIDLILIRTNKIDFLENITL